MKKHSYAVIWIFILFLLFDCCPADAVESIECGSGIYSFVHLSDTQYYTALAPEIFLAQCRFIADVKDKYDILLAAHSGDIIDCFPLENQWNNAKEGIDILLNARIPVQIAAGNHDIGDNHDYTKFISCFGSGFYGIQEEERYSHSFGEASAQVISTSSGHRWIFVSIGWNPSENALLWASEMISRYADCAAVVVTHDYLETDGTLSNAGHRIASFLVDMHPNVRLVLCGHNHACAMNVTAYDDDNDGIADRRVFSMLADYQAEGNLLTGNLRLLTVSEPDGIIYVRTYSTALCDFTGDAFVIRMDDSWFPDVEAERGGNL